MIDSQKQLNVVLGDLTESEDHPYPSMDNTWKSCLEIRSSEDGDVAGVAGVGAQGLKDHTKDSGSRVKVQGIIQEVSTRHEPVLGTVRDGLILGFKFPDVGGNDNLIINVLQ